MNDQPGQSSDSRENVTTQTGAHSDVLSQIEELFRAIVDELAGREFDTRRIERLLSSLVEELRAAVARVKPQIAPSLSDAAIEFDQALNFAVLQTKITLRQAYCVLVEKGNPNSEPLLEYLTQLEELLLETFKSLPVLGGEALLEISRQLAELRHENASKLAEYCDRAMIELDTIVAEFGDMSRDAGREIKKFASNGVLNSARTWLGVLTRNPSEKLS